MARLQLTNAQWEAIEPLLPGKQGDAGRTGADSRKALEGIIWMLMAALFRGMEGNRLRYRELVA